MQITEISKNVMSHGFHSNITAGVVVYLAMTGASTATNVKL